MPNFNFLACSKLRYRAQTPKTETLHTLNKNHPSVTILYKLCLWMLEEHIHLILTS